MQETAHYKLKKPGENDYADVAVLNENVEKVDGLLNGLEKGKAPTSHDHDSRYYTETEMDGKLGGKEGIIKSAPTKDTPVDTDNFALVDSADGNKTKRVLWSRIKAVLKGWFDTLYAAINHTHDPVSVGGIPIVTTYTPEGGVDGANYAANVPGVTELYAGLQITIVIHCGSETTAPSLNINGLGVKSMRKQSSLATGAGSISQDINWLNADRAAMFLYNGSFWVAVGVTVPRAGDFTGILSISNGGTGTYSAAEARANLGAAAKSAEVSGTLTAAGWSGSGPFAQALAVAGLLAGQNGDVGLAQSATAEQRAAARDAMISVTGQGAGTITVTADGDKPTVDIPVSVTMLG